MEVIKKDIEKKIDIMILFITIFIVIRVYIYGWVTDDAFITFKSVLNFIDGNGLVFNVGERVQSYTHALWFLILSLFAFFDTNLYFLSITMGVLFTVGFLYYLNKLFIMVYDKSYSRIFSE